MKIPILTVIASALLSLKGQSAPTDAFPIDAIAAVKIDASASTSTGSSYASGVFITQDGYFLAMNPAPEPPGRASLITAGEKSIPATVVQIEGAYLLLKAPVSVRMPARLSAWHPAEQTVRIFGFPVRDFAPGRKLVSPIFSRGQILYPHLDPSLGLDPSFVGSSAQIVPGQNVVVDSSGSVVGLITGSNTRANAKPPRDFSTIFKPLDPVTIRRIEAKARP
jgi:hypothetical protein